MLEPARIDSKAVTWVKDKPEPAPELIRRLDGRSMAAVSKGRVRLPGGKVSAAQWFKLMQTIFHELNVPLFILGRARLNLDLDFWEAVGYLPTPFYKTFKFDKSCALLIAKAIELMENGTVVPAGKHGKYFSRRSSSEETRLADSNSESMVPSSGSKMLYPSPDMY
jgi:hypothetical protein